MPTTFTPGDEQQDEKLNPGQQHADRQFASVAKVANREKRGTHNDSNYSNQTNENGAVKGLQSDETSSAPSFWKDYTDSSGPKKIKLDFRSLKKKGPLVSILGILGIGGFGFSVLLSPGMLFVHMKETYADKFNDQLAALDIRSNRVMAKKIGSSVTSGVCSSVMTIRCKYQTMSKRQIQKLDKAGIKVMDADGNPLTSRGRPASLELDGKSYNAAELQRELRSNSGLRNAFNRAYNPKVVAFSDKVAKITNTRLKISKKNNFDGVTSKEKATEKLRQVVRGEGVQLQNNAGIIRGEDSEGRVRYTDADTGETLSSEVAEARQAELDKLDAETKTRASLANTSERITRSSIKGALTVTALGAGAVDSSCTGYRIIRGVGFAAKYLGMLQLARYGYMFMNTADAIKAGNANPEQVEYLGNIITSTNSQGKSGTDSYGYKYAAYNEVGNWPSAATNTTEEARLADETLRYTNGQIVSKNIMSTIVGSVSGSNATIQAADKACGFVKSGWGQTILIGTAVIGGIAAFFTGGASLGWGAAAQISASVAIGVGVGMLTPKLIDMVSTTLVTGDENGNEANNAIVSGMGGYNAQISQTRGLAVLTKEDAVAYQNLTNETIALYNEADQIDSNPFDATNKNTFVGSFVSKLIPHIQRNNAVSATSALQGVFAAATLSLKKNDTTKAASIEEFNVCEDSDYTDKNLAADPFCNLRYGIKPETLNIDPDVVLDFMLDGGYIDEISGEASTTENGNEFKKFIDNCVNRTNPIGGYSEESDTSDLALGYDCIEGHGPNAARNSTFRLYLIDKSIIDEMEDEVTTSTAGAEGNGTLTAGGLSEEQGKALMHTYINDRSNYLSAANLRSYPNECVTFIKYFLAKYVDPKYGSGSLGNGRDVVRNLLSRGGGFVDGGNVPKLYAIASYPPGVGSASNGPYGHVAVVIGVNADGSTLVAEAGGGFKGNGTPRYTAVTTISAAESSRATYAYTDGLLKGMEGLSQ